MHLLAKSSEILISSYCPQFVVQVKGFGSISGLNDFSYTFKFMISVISLLSFSFWWYPVD